MSSRNKWQNELGAAGRGGKTGLILTQVPSHQIGIVEILHAQSDDVDEFLYDLHELHRPRIDLDGIRKMRRHTEEMRGAFFDFTNPGVLAIAGRMEERGAQNKSEEKGRLGGGSQMHSGNKAWQKWRILRR